MCGRCFGIYKKYFRECTNCLEKSIKPEEEDSVVICNACKIPEHTGGVCRKCDGETDANWKQLCTPCWLKDKNGDIEVPHRTLNSKRVGTITGELVKGICNICNVKVESWKTMCTPCWKDQNKSTGPGRCLQCNKQTEASWKTQCTPCWKKSKR